MKITNTTQRKIEIAKYDPFNKVDLETGDVVDISEILSELFDEGDVIKIQVTKNLKEEE
jgi:hypothetical protein